MLKRIVTGIFVTCAALFVFARALPAQSIVFLVRHAEKASASASEKDPDLSAAGHARADALAQALRDAGIKTIYVTEWKRTRETAAPLARLLGLSVTTVPAAEMNALVAKLHETAGNALVVGHSNTLPDLIRKLGVLDPIHIADAEYDDLFVVVTANPPRLLHLHYHVAGG